MSPSALRKRSFDANRVLEIKRRSDRSAAAAQDAQAGAAALRQLGLSSSVDASAAANANENENMSSERPAYSGLGRIRNDTAGFAA
jgi:hypothetical protein